MAKVIRKQVYAIKPLRAQVHCAFCGTVTWWSKRPELVYRGSHRYARWCCDECGRTSERARAYAKAREVTRQALAGGPGSPAWKKYETLETFA